MIRQDGAFELGAPQGGAAHPQSLWIISSVLMLVFFGANLWVYTVYPSDRVFHSLVLGGPMCLPTDLWRPFTAFLFEPNVPGLVASLLTLYLIVRELESARGTRWVLGICVATVGATCLGYLAGDRWLLGRSDVVAFGACAPLVVLCLAYARDTRGRNVYPFLFLQLKGRNLGLGMAVLVLAAYDFRTLPFWSTGEHGAVAAAAAPMVGVVGGVACLWLEPILRRRLAFARALREVQLVHRDAARKERVDRLLAKVAEQGMGALSRRELRFLERTSRLPHPAQEGPATAPVPPRVRAEPVDDLDVGDLGLEDHSD